MEEDYDVELYGKKLKPRKGLVVEDDILREVAEEFEIGFIDTKALFYQHKKYVKQLMDNEDVHCIYLRGFGSLKYNTSDAHDKRHSPQVIRDRKKMYAMMEEHSENTTAYKKYYNIMKGSMRMMYNNIRVYFELPFKRRIKNIDFVREIIEDFSNGKFKKNNDNRPN